jgi:HEPN domain-containing protein
MSDLEQARLLLETARRDLEALLLTKELKIADSIFGFHAQQAVEKALKAWLSLMGAEYPRTHDISLLLKMIEELGIEVEPFWPLITYNPFAVQLRYDAIEEYDQPLDRDKVIKEAENIIGHVEKILATKSRTM